MAIESGQDSGQLRGDINVTPLIDILLVLLIIFMVIVPVVPHGLGAALPRRHTNLSPSPESAIVVQIENARNGLVVYKINQDAVRIDELGSRLTSIFSARADKAIFVKGDDSIAFSTVARVIDIARSAGADHVGLLTSRDAL